MSDPAERPDFTVLERPAAEPACTRPARLPRAGRTVERVADWIADRIEDFAAWFVTLIRYLPARLLRIATTLFAALTGTARLAPRGRSRGPSRPVGGAPLPPQFRSTGRLPNDTVGA